jgi:hypothetical protein
MTTIPVMRPKLPSAERLAPYLRQIDEARFYSNFGPLVQRLEARTHQAWWVAGLSGALVGAIWNYTVSAFFTWTQP